MSGGVVEKYVGESCKNHADRDATGRCASCWSSFCGECLTEIGDHRYCATCEPAAHKKYLSSKHRANEERQRLDLRLLLYTLIGVLGVVIGGFFLYFNGWFDQYFGEYISSSQVLSQPIPLGAKVNGFQVTKTTHFTIYFHTAERADIVARSCEEYFSKILTDLLIYEKDIMKRGKFNIIIVKDNDEMKRIFVNIPANRAAMTDFETKTIVIVEANETGDPRINLTHEITHAIVFERFSGGNRIPDWIHEGLASYEEAKFDSSQVNGRWATFGSDIAQGNGLPLKSLTVKPDAKLEEVNLYYAESHSVVNYMINTFGMRKLLQLATLLQSGKDTDSAIKNAYAPDLVNLSDLEKKWLESLK